jgi:hypothetical protein
MQLETADVFARGGGKFFWPEELLEFIHVVSVSVDGIDREITDFHVLYHPNTGGRLMFLIRRHWETSFKEDGKHKSPSCTNLKKAQVVFIGTIAMTGPSRRGIERDVDQELTLPALDGWSQNG